MAMPHFEDGQVLFASDLNEAVNGVSENVSSVFTPSSGASVNAGTVTRMGRLVVAQLHITGLSSSTNPQLGTFVARLRPTMPYVAGIALTDPTSVSPRAAVALLQDSGALSLRPDSTGTITGARVSISWEIAV